MEILNRMRDFLLPEEFEVHMYHNKIHIMNFTTIGEISSEKIIVRYQEGTIIIKGENLVMSKLLHEEVLIRGVLKTVEFR